ncbi:MAG: ferrous iron transport protein A, partial [Saprospiraceae bacterium]|nr:ferrous iron transport protein A [Saprospiraceae bacterium]
MAASEIPLADLAPGTPARIVRLAEHPATARLLAMGLRPGIEVMLVRTA